MGPTAPKLTGGGLPGTEGGWLTRTCGGIGDTLRLLSGAGIVQRERVPMAEVRGVDGVSGEVKRPARGRPSDMASYFTTTLGPKRGFHPTFRTVISLPNGPWKGRQLHSNELLDGDTPRHSTEETTRCTLHVAHALPSTLFADPYELELRRDQFTFLLLGEHNLEFPVHAMTGTGQRLVLNVSLSSDTREIVVEFPLHLRYAEPGHGGHRPVAVPSPAPFWACPSLGAPAIFVLALTRLTTCQVRQTRTTFRRRSPFFPQRSQPYSEARLLSRTYSLRLSPHGKRTRWWTYPWAT